MRLTLSIALVFMLFVSQVSAQEKTTLKNQKEKISYVMGMNIGNGLRRDAIDIDPNILMKGLKDALAGGQPLLTEQEIHETMAVFQKEMTAKQAEIGKKNKKDGEAFLAANKNREGVKTLPSGLQYKVIKAGTGSKKPKLTDTVTVHYRAGLINGIEFDNSYFRRQPEEFQVNGVIPGWTEALQLMEEGAKWQLFIPSNLAYGENGKPGVIGPNMTLIFEIELISVKEKNRTVRKQFVSSCRTARCIFSTPPTSPDFDAILL